MGPQDTQDAVTEMDIVENASSAEVSNASDPPSYNLRQSLKERHVNMIGFSTMLGIGMFLSSGKAIFMAGPGAAVFAYIVTGTIISSVMACLGDMTALFPVRGAIFEFTRRFIDQSVGLAVGWLSWFSWIAIGTSEVLAITQLFKFRFPPKYLEDQHYPHDHLEWKGGLEANSAIWVGIFLFIILVCNLLPVRQYGRLEYAFGVLKMIFVVGAGMDIIIYTAPENRDLRKDETIKLATRKLSIRVITLYVLLVFTVGLNVPYDCENLVDFSVFSVTGGRGSALIIAAVRERVKFIPHLFNAFFIFSACSCGMNCPYASSRALHALASIREAWPSNHFFESIRRRLERTRMGVLMNAVFVSWLVMFLSFLSVTDKQSQTLGRMTTVAVVSNLLVYALNCVAYLNFYRQIKAAASGGLDAELNLTTNEMRSLYNRMARRFPYRTHLQWLRAVYALTGCSLFVIFQGWRSFVSPFSGQDFVAAYIAILLFITLTLAYFLKSRGISRQNFRVFAVGLVGLDMVGPIAVSPESLTQQCEFCGARHRRGYLRFPDRELFTAGNFRALVEWVWTWLK